MANEPLESTPPVEHLAGDDALNKVRTLLGNFKSMMLITFTEGDQLHVRPMGPVATAESFDGTLWFFTDRRSNKLREAGTHPGVSLVCQDDSAGAYLHLMGRASLVQDRAQMESLYTPIIKTWFPKGLDDPNVVLLRVDVDRGEFWDSPGGMLQVLGAFTKAVVTGTPHPSGTSGTVSL